MATPFCVLVLACKATAITAINYLGLLRAQHYVSSAKNIDQAISFFITISDRHRIIYRLWQLWE
jgi:hypothetical protein